MELVHDPARLRRVTVQGYVGPLDWREGAQVMVDKKFRRVAVGFDDEGAPASIGLVTVNGDLTEVTGMSATWSVGLVVSQEYVSLELMLQFARYRLNEQLRLQMSGRPVPDWDECKATLTDVDPGVDELWIHVQLAAATAATAFFGTRLVGGTAWIEEITYFLQRALTTDLTTEKTDILTELVDCAAKIGTWSRVVADDVIDEQQSVVSACIATLLMDEAIQLVIDDEGEEEGPE